MRIATVNVNGIRAAARKGMSGWLEASAPDVLLLQEVRADEDAAAGLLLILVWWVTSHAALGWLAVILLCGWDSMMPGSPVFLGLGSLSYSQWQCGTVVRNTGILLLLQLALFFAGLKYADRKDFLGDGYV